MDYKQIKAFFEECAKDMEKICNLKYREEKNKHLDFWEGNKFYSFDYILGEGDSVILQLVATYNSSANERYSYHGQEQIFYCDNNGRETFYYLMNKLFMGCYQKFYIPTPGYVSKAITEGLNSK
nr:MAG TPA: hypothetical protein [Caudoviricetes sp.]